MEKIVNDIRKRLPSKDYIYKKIKIDKKELYLIFNEVLCSGDEINESILKRLTLLNHKNFDLENKIPANNIKIIKKDEIISYVNKGFVVCLTGDMIFAIEEKQKLERGITTIESELSLNGPKDSFSESFNTNLGLIRRRIKSEDLWWDEVTLGKSTETKVGILYMNNIVDKDLVEKVKARLNLIDIDGIIDSSYLKDNLENNNSFFPTISSTERPDKVAMSLLEGKVAIIVDMSSYVLILPNFFIDFFHTVDDYYQKSINVTFIRCIRILAFFISIFIPAYYIAVTTYNQNSIFLSLLLLLKAQRTAVPFPAIVEALFMIISFEILRESDLRMSSTTGSAISILGGLILGDAAVNAGIVSPIMIIVIAITTISGLMFTDINMANALRKWRVILLIFASAAGLVGLGVGMILLIINLASTTSLKKPYTYPIAPLNVDALKKNFLRRKNISLDNKRQKILTDNLTKYRIDKEKS